MRFFALMAPLALAFSLMSGAALAPTSARAEAPEGETRYLCCNMRIGKDWLSDINYDEEGMVVVPYGTPAKILEVSRNKVRIEMGGKAYKFGNDYSRKLGMPEFIRRYLLVADPRPAQQALPDEARKAIESFTVVPGMTREQVLIAVAYPIADETPDLQSNTWKYWVDSSIEYDVKFDDQGVVTGVTVIDENVHDDAKCALNVYRPDWRMGYDRDTVYVQVDGKIAGKLRTGETTCVKLPPGKHRVEIRSQFLFNPAGVAVDADVDLPASGESVFLRYQRTMTFTGVIVNSVTWRIGSQLGPADEAQWKRRL